MTQSKAKRESPFLGGRRIRPRPVTGSVKAADLVESTFSAYNAARLREACTLFVKRMLEPDVTVGLSLTGALTPAGLGLSCLIPLMRAGFVDWMISTGANLYHDVHHGLGMPIHEGRPNFDDVALRNDGIIRIYDIVFPYEVLLDTDAFFREVLRAPEFDRPMSTAEFHWRAGRYVEERARALGIGTDQSVLASAYRYDVPIYTSSPGDSSIGMNVARNALEGRKFSFDVSADVNETAALVYGAKSAGGKSAVLIFGGGSPKNFLLQTEPQIQEVLGIDEAGHDYFVQFTDARPDTGGLSGATPAEAVSWGKIDPQALPDTVVCYLDATVAMPLFTAFSLARHKKRPLKRLYRRREELMQNLASAFAAAKEGKGLSRRAPVDYVEKLTGKEPAAKAHRGLRTHSQFGKKK
ncbi:MAG: Deoxyhypusine synthase-like protein [Thermoanaerobaculia bacterium]|nr:Deoxyhypusine synthase-like protein [Thermoanaerobaculia bacterium]